MMIVVIAVLQAQTGKEIEMENALKEIIPKVESEKGTMAYILHRSQSEPGTFMFYEKYIDNAAFEYHSSTPHFQELFGKIGPLLAGAPRIEMFEEIAAKK
ncbi:MAG: putative quinol monooxygenase [Spirochaetota bacterium]|nr:putative quinol monooxygenase [Spirochaetota bacterium]